jgi:hypothetical protein
MSAWRGGHREKNYEGNEKQKNTHDRTPNHTQAQTGSSGASCKAGETRSAVCRGATGAGAVPLVQTRMGRGRGEGAERARYAICMPVLPALPPRARTGARFPQNAPRAMDQASPSRGMNVGE